MLARQQSSPAVKEPPDPRLRDLVERAARATDAAYAFLLLWDRDTAQMQEAACHGLEHAPESCLAAGRWVLSTGETACWQDEAQAGELVGAVVNSAVFPLVCAPVRSGSSLQGALMVGYPGPIGEEYSRWLPLVETLAELAGAILENAALQRELCRKEEQVRDLVRDTVDAEEAERERICLEVHDGVTQTLASAFQYLQTLETTSPEGTPARQLLLRASALVKQAIQESREVINSLQPATLRDLGLVVTLRQEMRQLEQETRWEVDFSADAIRLATDMETGLYRIIHEAITNARKHADTDRLRVSLTSQNGHVKVEVRDWGSGFDYNAHDASRRRGTGLLSMRKRAELLQGSCDIESRPGQGTTVRVEIPVSA